jgi:hypothetical protein
MDRSALADAIRAPKTAAVAGLVFGLILAAVIGLLQSVAPQSTDELSTWTQDPERRDSVVAALALIPFAGIAFLWFVAVVRSELGRLGDRFFETVFLGSGLLFVAMLFAAAAVLSAALSLVDAGVTLAPGSEANAWALASALLGQFGSRMAAVFALTVSTAGRRAGTLPRAAAAFGYLCGLLLLLSPPLPDWAQFLFPLWVVTLSLLVLLRRPRQPGADPA